MDDTSELFDEFGHPDGNSQEIRQSLLGYWIRTGLRILGVAFRWIAIVTVFYLVARHAWPLFARSSPLPALKSAVPLIAIGISYLCVIFTVPRTPGQRLVGVSVAVAFILWGVEQFVENPAIAASIDDIVVFLFVVDLTIVIRHNLEGWTGETRLRKAGFPIIKTIESFRFASQPSVDEAKVRSLLTGEYIDRRENILLVGHVGTGKTHLARSLGYAACLQGRRVLYTTASQLASQLLEYRSGRPLRRFLKNLRQLDLLIVDEIGYAALSEEEAQLLFEVFSIGYEQTSFIITTIVPLEKWADIFGNERMTRALVGRLTDRAHLIETTGEAYRRSPVQSVSATRLQAR
jgi:DNA replication protein DnaC